MIGFTLLKVTDWKLHSKVETLRANVIAENLFAQLDDDGQKFQLLDKIIDHRMDSDAYCGDDAYISDRKGKKHLRKF
jgi:hypothetical protein